jgi:hypothetical protein
MALIDRLVYGQKLTCAALLLAVVPGCSTDVASRQPSRDEQQANAIQRVTIRSSVIPTVGYDTDREILEIEFHNGAVYQYFEVPPHIHQKLVTADSPGTYFNANIRHADFKYRQLVPTASKQ